MDRVVEKRESVVPAEGIKFRWKYIEYGTF
jgi:hypothetical protein